MSAIGPKRTSAFAPHMSAFRGKADMTICGMSAFAAFSGFSARADVTRVRINYKGLDLQISVGDENLNGRMLSIL